ncbi:LysR family transcriptional regulator [Salmonella enterica]
MQLRCFFYVAHSDSISRAANELFRTQSAVSRTIQDFEGVLKVKLFERRYNGMTLTDYGRCILPRVSRAIDELLSVPLILARHSEHTLKYKGRPDPGWLFNTRRLQIFLQIYQLKHTSTVAFHLGVTQPAISSALKILEKGAGVKLFLHSSAGIQPTLAADRLYPIISRSLNEIGYIRDDLALLRGILAGRVRIGALPLSRSCVLPAAVSEFLACYPHIKVMTNESPYETLIAELRAGNIDFTIGALRENNDLTGLTCEPLFEEDMLILVRSGHPLLSHPDTFSQLSNAEWIVPRANTPARKLLDQAFHVLGLQLPDSVVETGDAVMVREILLNSDRVAVVSSSQMRFEIEKGILRVLSVTLPGTTRLIGLTFLAGSLPSPATEMLVRFIHKQVQKQQTS